MNDIVISGSGYHHPKESISNAELVATYNEYVNYHNELHKEEIEANSVLALKHSSAEFIEKASGIKTRYVRDKKNLLNHKKMWPYLPDRNDNELSLQAETSVIAAKMAMISANKSASDIDAVILASSHKQRDFPSVSIEIQKDLGIEGFAFDMGAACSSAVFGIHAAMGCISSGTAKVVLVISPEIKSGQFCTRDLETNFIFGEATSALIVECKSTSTAQHIFKISNVNLQTSFSNNIRWANNVYKKYDKIDIIINNAGVKSARLPTWEVSPEDFEQTIRINVLGTVSVLSYFVPQMENLNKELFSI
ncbi:MAG: 3-oxoacyl-[acyl-carrier-protein] synthase [Burkholderiales bacterium]|jgi:beta-ketodecanoyl-[acyl-carrier-protein] synthase|nr:3-oxoacyl-[acyl-carrier-protein] synthase [Burkholderiales bacterium]